MKRILTGLGALLALAALMIGAPLALATWWGNPWPAGGWSEVQLLTNDTIVGAIVAIGWLAWAQMTACILLEIVTAIRHGADYLAGRTTGRLKFAAPGQQQLVQLLVTSVAALGLGAGAVTAGGAALDSTAPATSAHANPAPIAGTSTATPVATTKADAEKRVTTSTHTTAWKLAETHLGDGQRWKEVLDLNRGTRLPDGSTFTQGTQTIPTGSTLQLPADATVTQEREETKQYAAAPKHRSRVVVTGDTLWDITEDELGDPFRYPEVFEASTDTLQPGGERLIDPDLIKPGWTITIPVTHRHDTAEPDRRDEPAKPAKRKLTAHSEHAPVEPNLAPAAKTPAPQTQSPQVPAQSGAPTAGDHLRARAEEDTDIAAEDAETDNVLNAPWILSGLTGAGVLLAGGLYRGLRQRRAAQVRHRRPGRAVATPGPELAGAEMTISAAGRIGEDPMTYIDEALRRLAGTTHANNAVMPAVAAVELTADTTGDDGGRLTLHLSEHADLPTPWQPTRDRLHWHVSTSLPVEDLGDLSDEADSPYPLLVTIGEGDDGALWLLNCEDLGTLTLGGDTERTRNFARHLVAQLAVNPWSLGVTVDCIGIAAEAEPLGDRIHHHATPTEAASVTAEALADAVAMVDRTTGHHTDVATGRTGQHDDDTWPARLLLLDATTEEPEGLAALLELVETHPGRAATSIVLAGQRPDTAGIHLHLTPEGRVVLEQASLDLIAVGLTSEETSGVGLVYAQAEVLDDVPVPVDPDADDTWEAYADRSGSLRREHTLPRATPDTELTEPAVTLLEADDSEYVEQAAVVPEDLDALAPKIPASLRREVEAHLSTLDGDLADWYDEDSRRAKITFLGPLTVRTHGKPLAKNRPFYTELAAFLWLHRRTGVTREQVTTYFGTPTNRVRYRMSDLRGWLGTNPLTGRPYLPKSNQAGSTKSTGINVYQLDDVDGPLCDWGLFQCLRLRGETRGGPEGRADLQNALDLVAGHPCHHIREGGGEGLREAEGDMKRAIADVALTLTTHHLRDGDLAAARAATDIATTAAPDEEATRLCLVQITNLEGHRAEAERILRDDICNRTDDEDAPPELDGRTKAIIRSHDEWMAG